MRSWRLHSRPPTRHPEQVSQTFPIESEPRVAVPVGPAPEFQVELEVFEGPLPLLLHLIETAELDILTVPLSTLADGYVAWLATHPVDSANLAQFVATAAQLILLKSRSLLAEPVDPLVAAGEDIDEEELRRRLLAYRAIRDAAREIAGRDLVAPMWRREPRAADLPEAPLAPLDRALLENAMARMSAVVEPEPVPPEIVPREVTVGQQIAVLREAMAEGGKLVLQAILAIGTSRTERVVTLMAALELVRRRELRARQTTLFGPIVLERTSGGGS
jgi:segregation and condensation protein A